MCNSVKMCCCLFVVIKLLTLKILLMEQMSATTALRYDFGYHASAEEFDNLLHETRRTWTHSVLKNERNNLMTKQISRHQDSVAKHSRHFLPKFQYENKELNKFKHSKKYSQDLQNYSKPLRNSGSSLDFHYFSNELPKPSTQQTFVRKPAEVTSTNKSLSNIKAQNNLKPVGKPAILKNHKNSSKNNTKTNFPIYFTNPVTNIIYAITEIGKSTENIKTSNGTIPILITKEKYERDILQLKNAYKQKCKNSPTSTTFRPQIITLKKPKPINVTAIKKPSPVMITTTLMVKDKRPLRKKKKKTKQKHKIKKQNPGSFNVLKTTVRPSLNSQLEGPAIILGSRIYKSKEKLSTQLEKPDIDNIFSRNNHKMQKRSVQKDLSEKKRQAKAENLSNLENSLIISFASQNSFWKDLKQVLKNFTKAETTADLYNKDLNFSEIGKTLKTANSVKIFNKEFYISGKNLKNATQGNLKNLKMVPLKNNKYLKNFKNIKLIKNQENVFKPPKLSAVILIDLINKFNIDRAKHSRDFNKRNLIQNIIFPISTKNITQQSQIAKGLKKHFKNEAEHHLNKRSIVDLTKNNSILPQFVKRSNIQREHESTAVNELKRDHQSLEDNKNKRNSNNFIETIGNRDPFNLTIKNDKKTNLNEIKMAKSLTKKKLNNKLQINLNSTFNKGNTIQRLITTARTMETFNKSQAGIYKESRGNSRRKQQNAEYNFFDMDESYDDEEEYENDYNDQEEEEEEDVDKDNYKYRHKIPAYDDEPYQTYSSEISLTESPAPETNSSSQKATANRTSEIQQEEHLKIPTPYNGYKTKLTHYKKRTRRRPPQLKINDDYEEDEEDDSLSSNIGGFFRMLFYPVQMVMSSVMDTFSIKDADEEDAEQNIKPYTKYTSYHSMLKQHSPDDYDEDYDSNESNDDDEYSFSNWFKSWFTFNRRNKKIGSTTAAPIHKKPTKSSSWFSSWLGFGANDRISTETSPNEDYDEYDKWFASWFGNIKPKARKRTTTTTSTTTQIPQVPILTIVDPMKNPNSWIGILAHHIINQTSTANPLKNIWNTVVTTTTTENPEMPRKVLYDKYQIWRLKPQDMTQVKALEEYKRSEDGIKLQWLKGPSLRGLTDVLVPPKMLVEFQASLTFELIDHEVLIFDVGKAIAYEKTKEDYFFTTTQKPKNRVDKIPTQLKGMTWYKYYEYDDIVNYLETMRMRFPYLVELIHIGRSYEGRPLIVVKIESKEAAAINSANYPAHQRTKLRHRKHIGLANAVFIEAGVHGMEWIAPATATWIINELLRIMKKNITDDQSFIRNTTWYIMPVLNPDGYVYSHEFDRFWKKSRSRHISRPSGIFNSAMTWLQKKQIKEKLCFGVDLDRNWHYQWGRRGSSKSACNDFYAGPISFSDPETKALSDFLMDYRTQIKLFVSMQAYGQIISYPHKANKTYDSERLEDLLDVAMVGIDALRKKGSKLRYKIDSSNDLIEHRSGSSDAFAAYEAGIPFSYTLQLADNGVHGYLLPSAAIETTAKDSFEIIKGMLDYI